MIDTEPVYCDFLGFITNSATHMEIFCKHSDLVKRFSSIFRNRMDELVHVWSMCGLYSNTAGLPRKLPKAQLGQRQKPLKRTQEKERRQELEETIIFFRFNYLI